MPTPQLPASARPTLVPATHLPPTGTDTPIPQPSFTPTPTPHPMSIAALRLLEARGLIRLAPGIPRGITITEAGMVALTHTV